MEEKFTYFKCELPDDLIVGCWSAVDIYPAIRAVVLKYNKDIEHLLMRYYLDRVPLEEDYEAIDVFAFTFSAQSDMPIVDIDTECVYSTESLSQLDCLDGFFFARQEF